MNNVAVIGAGNVGGTLAQRIVEADLAQVVLVDIAAGLAQGKACDLADVRPVLGTRCRVRGTTDLQQIEGADIVVVTAGLARQPGMSREDLLKKNAEIIGQVVDAVKQYAAESILLMVTNPLDVMTQFARVRSGFPRQRVLGMGGVLDTARFANLVAETLNADPAQVNALVIGAHGPGMLPLARYCTVGGIPLPQLLDERTIGELAQRTVERGAEIVQLLGKGSAYYAPAAAAFRMVQMIVHDSRAIVPACVCLDGEYGVHDTCVGVPVRLGRGGVAEIVEVLLTADETGALQEAARRIGTAAASLVGGRA